MTPHYGTHRSRLQRHIVPLSATNINSTELWPVNSASMWQNMNAGVCNIHSTNHSLSNCIYYLYVCGIQTLPILWNISYFTCITIVPLYTLLMCYVSPASSVPAVCSMLQNFKQEIYFKQLSGFNFYIDQLKGTFLAVSVIRHTFTTQNKKLLHISCTSHKYYLHLATL